MTGTNAPEQWFRKGTQITGNPTLYPEKRSTLSRLPRVATL
jgi:hypothetical protein